MTNEQEIRAKSLELAISFMGLVFELPIADQEVFKDVEKDETGELAKYIDMAHWISKQFEKIILKEPSLKEKNPSP